MTDGLFDSEDTDPDRRPVLEPKSRLRTEAQRDRDRILYSSAFQRLAGITQVSTPQPGLHNRLTHSLKVAQVGRRIAESWRDVPDLRDRFGSFSTVQALDPDAVEAAGLGHDLGHPPFGHVAEVVLAELARQHGGFEGNAQSFRIVNYLAVGTRKESNYRGLNLTRRTLNGILKYPYVMEGDGERSKKFGAYHSELAAFEHARAGYPIGTRSGSRAASSQRSLDAEVMDWADDVTYAVHDLEDYYRAGFISVDRVFRISEETHAFLASCTKQTEKGGRLEGVEPGRLAAAFERLGGRHVGLLPRYDDSTLVRSTLRYVASGLIGRYIEAIEPVDPATITAKNLRLAKVHPDARDEVDVLKELTWYSVIENPGLGFIQSVHRRIIKDLFDHFSSAAAKHHWSAFPLRYREEFEQGPRDSAGPDGERSRVRIVLDLIATLTEAEAYDYYNGLAGRHQLGLRGPIHDQRDQRRRATTRRSGIQGGAQP